MKEKEEKKFLKDLKRFSKSVGIYSELNGSNDDSLRPIYELFADCLYLDYNDVRFGSDVWLSDIKFTMSCSGLDKKYFPILVCWLVLRKEVSNE